MSRNAKVFSLSKSFNDGISPAACVNFNQLKGSTLCGPLMILQKMHDAAILLMLLLLKPPLLTVSFV